MKGTKDATGMRYLGRAADGRYRYWILGTSSRYHVVCLTQKQRVTFAVLRKLVAQVAPGHTVNPATGQGAWGSVGGTTIWLPVKTAGLDRSTCETIAHELVHNEGRSHGRAYNLDRDWWERESAWRIKISKATSGYTSWPKVDMRKLRDSLTPQERRRRAKAQARTRKPKSAEDRWRARLAAAEGKLDEWTRKLRQAEGRVAKWEKERRKAELWLGKAVGRRVAAGK